MKIYLKEKIFNPDLFTGRKQELAYFLNWASRIKLGLSRSTALLSRRKTGKSALLQRLYNIIFHKNDNVVPFYYEFKETNKWLGTFAEEFFLTFIYQYIAFKSRNSEYLFDSVPKTFKNALEVCSKEGIDYLAPLIKGAHERAMSENADFLWDIARDAPRVVAGIRDEQVVQIIDEFQYINRFVCRDKACRYPVKDLAGSYFHTVEYRNAPLLVSGSWVGWLMDDLQKMLTGRVQYKFMKTLPEDEAIEMIYRYSGIEGVPVTEKTAFLLARLSEGNPFYISLLFGSEYPGKNFLTRQGIQETLEFETLDEQGEIRGTWLEYIDSAFPRINEKHAKEMVLFLSKHRDRFVPRREIKERLKLDMTDAQLDKKLRALWKCDIIERERVQYRGIQDNIFDKIFRSYYADDIDSFITKEAPDEYRQLFEDLTKNYESLSGEHNRYKGAFAEFVISSHLRNKAFKNQDLFRSMIKNLPENFEFAAYKSVWQYHSPPLFEPEFQIDVFARAIRAEKYSLIWEVKNRKTTKFSLKEARDFMKKAKGLVQLEKVEKFLPVVFSAAGFYNNAIEFLEKNQIAWSEDPAWLDHQKIREN